MSGSHHTIYVLDPYHPDAISLLQNTRDVTTILPSDPARTEWYTKADGVILRSETSLTKSEFAKAASAGRLKVIVKQGVGVDNIDLDAAKEYGIAVHNTPALNSEAVAELCMAVTLSLTRRVSELDRKIRNGEKVVRSQMLGVSMFRKTVGVVGMGNIGKLVAEKWRAAFDCRILGYDPLASKDVWGGIEHKRVESLDELLREADMVTLHVPLLKGTRGMIGKRELGLMKKTAVLVNCARGGVVDEEALLEALQQKTIWGAALDAVEKEPVSVETYGELMKCENLIMTPHVGASTVENQSKSGTSVVETLLKVLNGEEASGKLV